MNTSPTALTDGHVDLYIYTGMVNMDGYRALCRELNGKECQRAILAITTPGGDPHAAFRIARALQHEYDGRFSALIPGYCKSAGTLIAVGVSELFMADSSELGPLDVQVRRGDELVARNSGLEIFEAITFLQNQTLQAFRQQVSALVIQGLSTRVAADIAVRLTRGIFEPIRAASSPRRARRRTSTPPATACWAQQAPAGVRPCWAHTKKPPGGGWWDGLDDGR